MNKKAKGIIQRLEKSATLKDRKCLIPNCTKLAIKSHLLQKNGILNQISRNGHAYQVKSAPFRDFGLEFKLTGIGDLLTFKGLCKHHDDSVFAEIEKIQIQSISYREKILFSFRAILNEQRKKEIVIDWHNRVLNSETLRGYVDRDFIKASIKGNELGLRDNIFIINELWGEIHKPTGRFLFVSKVIQQYQIFTSSIYTYDNLMELMLAEFQKSNSRPSTLLLNIIPVGNEIFFILGGHKDDASKLLGYFNKIEQMNDLEFEKELSDILLLNIESWACSPEFYLNKIKPKESKILKTLKETVNQNSRDINLEINLFQ